VTLNDRLEESDGLLSAEDLLFYIDVWNKVVQFQYCFYIVKKALNYDPGLKANNGMKSRNCHSTTSLNLKYARPHQKRC